MNFACIILAAGLSSRMSEFKPLLPFQGEPAIVKIINTVLGAGLSQIKVVIGHRADELESVLRVLPVSIIMNHKFAEGMFSSIVAGVSAIQRTEMDGSEGVDGFFVLPVDVPLVSPETLRSVVESFSSTEHTLICHPVYKGKRGHPPLVSARLTEQLLKWKGKNGLKGFLHKIENNHPDAVQNIKVNEPAILLDMDTDEDYRLMQEYLSTGRQNYI